MKPYQPYYKQNLGSYCRENKCKKRRILKDDIGYVIYGLAYCKEHAQKECEKHNLEMPDVLVSQEQKDIFEFLKERLRLEVRETGGCPEENYPPDRDVYLVLAGQVISEIRLD